MHASSGLSHEGLLSKGLEHQRSGRLSEASAIYRHVLALDPENFDALHLLGVVHYQLGAHFDAATLIEHAIGVNADVAAAHSNLGQVYRACNRLDAAVDCFKRASTIDPHFVDAANGLAAILFMLGRYKESICAYERVLEL